MFEEASNVPDAECALALDKIFGGRITLLQSIAPDGWINSEYIHLYHPTPEQQLSEYNRISENIASLTKRKGDEKGDEPRKTLADFEIDDLQGVNEQDDLTEILGKAVWDIFSDNHEVIAEDGRVYDLGSFRGTGSTIADYINEHCPLSAGTLDYMDFYMGTIWIDGRANLLPFYKHIFTVLKNYNCDWNYSFPKIGLVSFKKPGPENHNPADYSPLQSMQDELLKIESEIDKLQEQFNKIYEQEYEDAKYKPLPLTVQAYKEVYGILPNGHPQKQFE